MLAWVSIIYTPSLYGRQLYSHLSERVEFMKQSSLGQCNGKGKTIPSGATICLVYGSRLFTLATISSIPTCVHVRARVCVCACVCVCTCVCLELKHTSSPWRRELLPRTTHQPEKDHIHSHCSLLEHDKNQYQYLVWLYATLGTGLQTQSVSNTMEITGSQLSTRTPYNKQYCWSEKSLWSELLNVILMTPL